MECGRRFGKTHLGTNRLITGAVAMLPVAWFAPSYKHLTEVWRETCSLLRPIDPIISQQEKRIELFHQGSGAVIDFWSLDDANAVARGRKYGRVVIDEASVVRDLQTAWQESIRPTLADLKGDAWFLGTPKGRNFFHQLFARGQNSDPEWASWRMPTTANPFIDPAEVESARRDMPPGVFEQEFMGIPADDGGNPFGAAAIVRCLFPLSGLPPVVFGCDLAKSYDWCVLCGLDQHGHVCVLERWQGDWGATRDRILSLIGFTPTLIDSTGVGDPILEDIARQRPNVEGLKFTSTSKQQLMEGLAAAIQRGEVGFPDGWLRNELDSFEYDYRPGGGVRYSAPGGLHDDGVCGIALAVKMMKDRYLRSVDFSGGDVESYAQSEPARSGGTALPTRDYDDDEVGAYRA